MYVAIKRKLAARIAFFLGIVFTLIGAASLGLPLGIDSAASVIVASVCLISGAFFATFAVKLHRKSSYIFISALLLQIGILSLLLAFGFVETPFVRLWPVIVLFSGFALIPTGGYSSGGHPSRFIIPVIVFILMGLLFLSFSLKLFPWSFKALFLSWGPVILLISGVTVILAAIVSQHSGEDN